MNACISTQKFVEIVEFDASGVVGGIIKNNIKPSHKFYNVSYKKIMGYECLHLYEIYMYIYVIYEVISLYRVKAQVSIA